MERPSIFITAHSYSVQTYLTHTATELFHIFKYSPIENVYLEGAICCVFDSQKMIPKRLMESCVFKYPGVLRNLFELLGLQQIFELMLSTL